MENSKLIDSAADKVGGISELARRLDWDKGSIAKIKGGKKPLPPYRASQLAEIIGSDPKLAYLSALQERAESDGERKLLGELIRVSKAASSALTILLALYLVTFISPKPGRAEISLHSAANIHYSYLQDVLRGARLVLSWLLRLWPRPDGCVRSKCAFTVG